MDPTAAGNATAATHTVGGRPVNTSGGRGRRPKKIPSFARDARLARDGARLMTGSFRPPGEPPVFTPAATVLEIGNISVFTKKVPSASSSSGLNILLVKVNLKSR